VRLRLLIAVGATALMLALPPGALADRGQLSAHQRAVLRGIAADTWKFYAADVDRTTDLPLDNLGPGTARGSYTSAANIGVYLWAVVAAHDLGLIDRSKADSLARATLREVSTLKRYDGFLFQWYDTNNGNVLLNPGQSDCAKTGGTTDNCSFVSAVDNGWYASGLVEVREALPELRGLADSLLDPMDFSIFYDSRPQTNCNVNAAVSIPHTGAMYGGYDAGVGPAPYHVDTLYSDPRIAMYMGMGRHQMPGDVWWRTWRTLPPKRCASDPDYSSQGQWPTPGYWRTYTDPQSGKRFPVWEGHYVYPGSSLTFVPTYAGGMFEGLMANLVVPETTWGPHSLGLDDLRWPQVQIKYATQVLRYPVWGISPSSTADDTGDYGGFGVEGLAFASGGGAVPSDDGLALCTTCATETTVSPHASAIALPVLPQDAYANLQTLRRDYPGIYTSDGGFYDAVNPRTGSIGHRRLVLDQSMIMAGIDDALRDGALQRRFAADPISWAAKEYLGIEQMSIQ
jgi:Putative glucoamylase/Protein of unknown function (DUF3131)